MGLILDTSVLIAIERRGSEWREVLESFQLDHAEIEAALSAISVVELTHGIYRARTEAQRNRRFAFCEEVFRDLQVYPVSLDVARLAGRIEGE